MPKCHARKRAPKSPAGIKPIITNGLGEAPGDICPICETPVSIQRSLSDSSLGDSANGIPEDRWFMHCDCEVGFIEDDAAPDEVIDKYYKNLDNLYGVTATESEVRKFFRGNEGDEEEGDYDDGGF